MKLLHCRSFNVTKTIADQNRRCLRFTVCGGLFIRVQYIYNIILVVNLFNAELLLNMPRECCVTNCTETKGTYRFPNEPGDEERKKKWRAAIPRDNIPDHKDTVICHHHWPKDTKMVKVRGKWKPVDPPSIFDCVHKSLIPTPPPPSRTTKRTSTDVRSLQPDEMSKWKEIDRIGDFISMKSQFKFKEFNCPLLIFTHLTNEIIVQSVDFVEGTGVPKFLIKIQEDHSFETYHYGVRCFVPSLVKNRVTKLKHWSEIEEIIRHLRLTEPTPKENVMKDQLMAMGVTLVGEKKYTVETTVRAFEYFALSRSTYSRLREDFELPCIATLTSLTSKIKSADDPSFISNIFSKLPEKQKTCFIIIDEVYVKSMLQYHGGILFGKAVNKPEKVANTILSFMICCLQGGPKFLFKMLPVKELDADFLYEQTQVLLDFLKNAGADCVAIICDGNRVNQSFFKKFNCIEPWRTTDNIFLLFDFVHLIKNIRNNWITESMQELLYSVNGETKVAKWSDLKLLYDLESGEREKLSKLSEVSVSPKPIERQKVSFVLQVFNEKTISALKNHSGIKGAEGTITFLEIILQFWKIVNVKGPYADIVLRDPLRQRVNTYDDENLHTLQNIADMVEQMGKKCGSRKREEPL